MRSAQSGDCVLPPAGTRRYEANYRGIEEEHWAQCAERGTHACKESKLGPVKWWWTQDGKLGITIQGPPPESGRRTHLLYFTYSYCILSRVWKLATSLLVLRYYDIYFCFPFSRAKCWTRKKRSHETSAAERARARLLYLTQTGEHWVFSIKGGDPVLRFLTKRGRKTQFSVSICKPHHGFASVCGETERSILQGLARPWDTNPVNSQDATKQRGAEMTWQEACLGIKRVRKHNNATSKRKNPDSDSQAHTQLAQGHQGCTLKRQERGRIGCHSHLRLDQPASKLWPYDPCSSATVRTANPWSGRNGREVSWTLSLACTKPSLWEGYGQACTVLGPAQGKEHGAQPMLMSQGQQQKPVRSQLQEMDERHLHHSLTPTYSTPQQANNMDSRQTHAHSLCPYTTPPLLRRLCKRNDIQTGRRYRTKLCSTGTRRGREDAHNHWKTDRTAQGGRLRRTGRISVVSTLGWAERQTNCDWVWAWKTSNIRKIHLLYSSFFMVTLVV